MKILFENKQLNEGPGAGYTVSGTLTNVKVNAIKGVESAGKDDYGTYFEVELDASATFENVRADSYYYGGDIDSTPVSIIRARINSDNEPTIEDVKEAIEDAKINVTLGGGWSHSTFDGFIEGDLNQSPNSIDTYYSVLDAILFELIDKKAIEYIDKAVQNENTETVYAVMDENDYIVDVFGTEEESISFAKENEYPKVQIVYSTEDFNGDVEDEYGDIIWTPDMEESLREDITDDIKKESDDALSNGSVKEMSNVIFDTLFKNTHYPQLDFDKVNNQEVDANKGQIVFDYMGHEYKITIEESSENFTEAVKKSINESYTEDERIEALAKYLDIDVSEISNTYDNEFETPDGDYLVVTESEARELAEEDIRNLYDELGLNSFTPDFRDWIIMNALDAEWFEEAVKESYESYVYNIEYESDPTFDNRLIQELYDANILTEDDFEEDEDGEPDFSALKDGVDIDSAKEEYVDRLVYDAGDPVDYCGDNFGWDWVTEMATAHNLIELDEVVDQCIYMDGIAHFIARYDGEEIELGDDLFAYRTN